MVAGRYGHCASLCSLWSLRLAMVAMVAAFSPAPVFGLWAARDCVSQYALLQDKTRSLNPAAHPLVTVVLSMQRQKP